MITSYYGPEVTFSHPSMPGQVQSTITKQTDITVNHEELHHSAFFVIFMLCQLAIIRQCVKLCWRILHSRVAQVADFTA